MTTPLDGSAATASHSDDLRAKQPGSPDLLDLIKVKPDAGKDLMCTAGRVSDDGGPLPDVAVEMSSATSSVAPQRPAISSEYFVQAGGTDDPHGKALHNKIDHSLRGGPHEDVSGRRHRAPHAVARPAPRAHPHGRPAAGKSASQHIPKAAARSAVAGDTAAEKARALVKIAQGETDSAKALKVLNEGYANAPHDVKDAILKDVYTWELFALTADKANAPLKETVEPARLQKQTHEAMVNLWQVTKNLGKDFAAAISQLAVGDYERVYDTHQYHGDLPGGELFGPVSKDLLHRVLDRAADSPRAEDIVSRFIAIGVLSYDLDKAAGEVKSAQDKLDQANAAGDRSLHQKLNGATARLNATIAAEIAVRVSMAPKAGVHTEVLDRRRDEIAKQTGNDIVEAHADDPKARKLVSEAVGHVLENRRDKAANRETKIQEALSKQFNVSPRTEGHGKTTLPQSP